MANRLEYLYKHEIIKGAKIIIKIIKLYNDIKSSEVVYFNVTQVNIKI